MEDTKKPNELEEFDQFVGNTEEKMFQSLFPEMEEQEKSYLDIKNPSSRQPPGAQCGVMRAAATHTTTKPSSREQFCSAGCRQQTAVRRGQSVGQLRHHEEEEDLKKGLKIPIVISKERPRLGNSRHRIQGAGLVDQGLLVVLFVLSLIYCICRIQTSELQV